MTTEVVELGDSVKQDTIPVATFLNEIKQNVSSISTKDLKRIKEFLKSSLYISGSLNSEAEEAFQFVEDSLQERLAFIESKTAKETIAALWSVGLQFNGNILDRFNEKEKEKEFNSRYGNGFAEISRYIVKLLYEKSTYKRLQMIFVHVENDSINDEVQDGLTQNQLDILKNIQEKLRKINTESLSEPAQYLITLIQQVCKVGTKSDTDGVSLWMGSSLYRYPNSPGDGSCKDSEMYYSDAMDYPNATINGDKKLAIEFLPDSDEPALLVKVRSGIDTAINLVPLTLDGVTFAPGHVCRFHKGLDGKVYIQPLRATAFMISDEDDMRDAFGRQIPQIEENSKQQWRRDSKGTFMRVFEQGWKNRVRELFPNEFSN